MSLPPEARFPWFVHVDEAQQYAAQARPESLEVRTWRAVCQALSNLGVLGRAYGAVPCLYTQRIADINKSVISQQELRIFLKATLHSDLARYRDYINPDVATDETIRALGAGEGVVCLPDGRQFLARFLNRESAHGSHTPHLEEALRFPVVSPSFPCSFPISNSPINGNEREMALEADREDFEAYGNEAGKSHSEGEMTVSDEVKEMIRRMVKRGFRHGEIASIVGLAGRKYGIYKQVCRELDIEVS
jgi:hypothetical protein